MTMKLTARQQDLLDAIRRRVQVFYSPCRLGTAAYYYRSDSNDKCTAEARALLNKGCVAKEFMKWRYHVLVARKATQ